jgi:hypothetical protein
MLYYSLQHALSLLCLMCLQQSLLGNGSQNHSFLCFLLLVLRICRLSQSSSWLQLTFSCIWRPSCYRSLVLTSASSAECPSQNSLKAIVKVMLWPTVSWPAFLGVKPLFGVHEQIFITVSYGGLLMWDALSLERAGLSFRIVAGPASGHPRIWVPRDSRPYFTVSDSTPP